MTVETIPWPPENGGAPGEAVQKRYEAAVDSFVARVREDMHILAAILFGSLSYDQVWEHSDIDMWLIARDERKGAGRSPG